MINSLDGESIKVCLALLPRKIKLDKRIKDNGVLVLLQRTTESRIEVGYTDWKGSDGCIYNTYKDSNERNGY